MKKRILFIVNPKSGTKTKVFRDNLIPGILDLEKFDYEVVYTEYAGHGTELAKNAAAEKIDYVVIAGGDGSFNDAAQALVNTDTALGILPLGSGNGVARKLKIPLKTTQALALLNDAKIAHIDAGVFNDKLFFMAAGIGYDGLVIHDFEQFKSRGVFAYVRSILRTAWTYKGSEYTLEIEGKKIVHKAFSMLFSIIGQLGYGIEFDKTSRANDGIMEVVFLKVFPKWKVLWVLFQAFFTDISKNPVLEVHKLSYGKGTSNSMQYFQVDGDWRGEANTVEVKVIPNALKVITPQNFTG